MSDIKNMYSIAIRHSTDMYSKSHFYTEHFMKKTLSPYTYVEKYVLLNRYKYINKILAILGAR